MTKAMPKFEPGHGYTQEDWDEVAAAGDWKPTDEELATARPFAEVFPDLAESIRRGPGRPRLDAPKVQVSLRLDPDVLAKWKATGKGWQGRVNAALKAAEAREHVEEAVVGKEARVVEEISLREETGAVSGAVRKAKGKRTGEVTPS